MATLVSARKTQVGVAVFALLVVLLYVVPVIVLAVVIAVLLVVMALELFVVAIGNNERLDGPAFVELLLMFALIVSGAVNMIYTLFRPHGPTEFLLIGCIVIATDTAAQIVGRRKGHEGTFFPGISPTKSREGAKAGLYAGEAVALGIVTAYLMGVPLFTEALRPLPVFVLLAMPFLAIAGDLFASHLKRRFGVKDYANYIPGTGGALDRLDSWLPGFLLARVIV